MLAVHAEAEAGERDADLRRRRYRCRCALRVVEDAHDARAPARCPARPGVRWWRAARRRWRTRPRRRARSRATSSEDDAERDEDARSRVLLVRRHRRRSVAPATDTSARRRTSSTSNSKSPMTTRSPAVGRWPSASVTKPFDGRRVRLPRRARATSPHRRPASGPAAGRGRRAAFPATGSPALNSSPTSPSSSDSTSSSVMQPGRCRRTRRRRAPGACGARAGGAARGRRSRFRARWRSGRMQRSRACRRVPPLDEPAHEILRVQHADDVVDRVAIDRQARVRALRDEPDHFVERRVDVDRRDLAAAAPSAAWPGAGSGAARAAAGGARRARAVRRRGSPRSAARSLPANECAGAPAAARRQARSRTSPSVQPRDERPVEPQRRRHRDDGVERRLRRVLERERLRDQLREDHLRDRQQQQDDDDGRRLRGDLLEARPAARSTGVSQPAMVACAYAPRTRLERVMPIWQAAM